MDREQIFLIVSVIGVSLLVAGAVSIPNAKFNQKTGCELNRKLSLDDKIVPDVAQFEYDLCQKEAELTLKWAIPVLIFGAIITSICAIILAIVYYRQRNIL